MVVGRGKWEKGLRSQRLFDITQDNHSNHGDHACTLSISPPDCASRCTGFRGYFPPARSRPQSRFIEQMLFGIAASQDCKLSQIGRALGEDISLKKTVERLSHHLAAPALGSRLQQQILADAAGKIHRDTLLVVDPTDIRKPYAQVMPYLATVRDGSSGELVRGYWACVALACEPASRRVLPLMQQLWSAEAPDYESENAELLAMVDAIAAAAQKRGIFVLDRGGDRMMLYKPLLERGLRFIVRRVGNRHLMVRGRNRLASDLARGVPMRYAETLVQEAAGGEKKTHIEYGFCKVRLPGRRKEELTLVVIRGFGKEPLLLLTNVAVRASRCSVWAVVSGYLTRWLVEETIRFIKQSYRLEDMRVLDYQRLKNLTVLVLATAYFCASWLGERLKLSVLVTRVTGVAKRFFGVPEFHYYALADGIGVLLSRLGAWSAPRGLAVREASASQPWLFHFP